MNGAPYLLSIQTTGKGFSDFVQQLIIPIRTQFALHSEAALSVDRQFESD